LTSYIKYALELDDELTLRAFTARVKAGNVFKAIMHVNDVQKQ
jgi:hypothetical protein